MISPRLLLPLPIIIGLLVCEYKLHVQGRAEDNLPKFYSALVNGEVDEAQASIAEAIRLSPDDARYAAWNAYVDGQTVPAEVAQCSQAEQLLTAPQRVAAERAIAGYQKAAQLNRFDAQFHHNMAWLYHRLGEDQHALEEFEAAVRLDQPNPIQHASFGLLLESIGEANRANEEYARAIALSPQLIDSRFFEDLKHRSAERAKRVLKTSAGLVGASKNPILEAKLGRIYAELGEEPRATSLLNDALRNLPNLPLAWANLGNLQAASGDASAALLSYRKATTLDPGLVMPNLRAAEIYRGSGSTRQALQSFQVAAHDADAKLPPSVSHDSRLYRGSRQPIDSQLPTVLFRYMNSCDGPQAYEAMAELNPRARDAAYFRTRGRDCGFIQSPYRICPANSVASPR